MKVVINACYGGFSLSPEAILWLFERGFDYDGFKNPVADYWRDLEDKGILGYQKAISEWRKFLEGKKKGSLVQSAFLRTFSPDEKFVLDSRPPDRSHPLLIECVETLQKESGGSCAQLKVVEIPDGIEWTIEEYDGNEWVAEKHRSWS